MGIGGVTYSLGVESADGVVLEVEAIEVAFIVLGVGVGLLLFLVSLDGGSLALALALAVGERLGAVLLLRLSVSHLLVGIILILGGIQQLLQTSSLQGLLGPGGIARATVYLVIITILGVVLVVAVHEEIAQVLVIRVVFVIVLLVVVVLLNELEGGARAARRLAVFLLNLFGGVDSGHGKADLLLLDIALGV